MGKKQPHPLDRRGQEEHQAREEEFQRIVEETRHADFAWLMGNQRGRRLVWWFLEMGNVFETSFDTNALAMARKSGLKEQGIELWRMINEICPEKYVKMAVEQNQFRNEHYRDDSTDDK
ncbi:hypothetical protein [Prosthecochloris sp.]|uniref:Bbp19 family protein n=1 Tax=Prosthecochloris sp. TaxID=290513 RepID=UPI00257D81FA|nr:hypothetical protein [Prosthecochloris sp.]